MQSLRLHHASLGFQPGDALGQFGQNRLNGRRFALRLHHVVALGVDRQSRVFLLHGAEQRIDLRQRINLVAEELNAVSALVVSGKDFDHIAAHAKGPAAEVCIVALVQNVHQPPRNVSAADALPLFEQKQHAIIRLR